jgi:hypothetical protein
MAEDYPLPDDLPELSDDGAAEDLPGAALPDIALPATDDSRVTLADLPGRTVVYAYPQTGRPDRDAIPDGWDEIPDARDCTPKPEAFATTTTSFGRLGPLPSTGSRSSRRATSARSATGSTCPSNS